MFSFKQKFMIVIVKHMNVTVSFF